MGAGVDVGVAGVADGGAGAGVDAEASAGMGLGVGAGLTSVIGSASAALACPNRLDSGGPASVTLAMPTTEASARRTTYSTRVCPDCRRVTP